MGNNGYFTVKSKVQLDELELDAVISESDYSTLTPSGAFVQLEYHEASEVSIPDFIVKPGIWVINHSQAQGMFLSHTSFVVDKILEDFVHTKHITDKIDLFFDKIQVYYDMGFEIPKRAALIYGPAGTGKSTAITKVSKKYNADGKTAIVVWPTSKYEAQNVKDFVKSFKYEGVERLIMIIEDIGGVEVDQVRMKSDSALLSLLDNQEKTFTIPVFIIATTNFPEVFLGNLTNRPNRFDDKIEVGFPEARFRSALLKFFTSGEKIKPATSGDL
ncbi:MAG TPA: AAA family ATPase, partial [Aquella sp.]|nr:AAA family ATPase [Aquella sp.]